jgi:hypothetical protein
MLKARIIVVSLFALARPSAADTDLVTKQLAALGDAASCKDAASPFRPWCIAADFANGKLADLPKGKTLVGITVELEVGKDAKAALTDKVIPAALVIDDKGMVKITDITPSNDGEKTMLGEAVFNLSTVFKHKARTAKLPKDLASYVKTMKAKYKPSKSPTEWTWTGESAARLRRVGDFWVSVETPTEKNGIWVSVFTDKWE